MLAARRPLPLPSLKVPEACGGSSSALAPEPGLCEEAETQQHTVSGTCTPRSGGNRGQGGAGVRGRRGPVDRRPCVSRQSITLTKELLSVIPCTGSLWSLQMAVVA